MPTYTHGGDIWGFSGPVLDFSANLHPLGMPEEVARAAQAAVADAIHYPDPLCRGLRRAIGERDGVEPEQVICGCGAADLISRLCLALRPRRALVTAPTFSEYGQSLGMVGCRTVDWPLLPEEDFDLSPAFLDAIVPGIDLIFLCTPNNPTGRLVPTGRIAAAAERAAQVGAVLAVDECFIDLTDARPVTDLLEQFENLFLLRAFTKSYAIPGLRLGYGLCSDGALLEKLYAAGQPWAVSTVAQAAGIAACGLPQWPEEGRRILRTERPRLAEGLRNLGCTVWDGAANYLLFRREGDTTLKERLARRGILIRSCGNYRGLGPDYYRTAVRVSEDNDTLLRALKEVFPQDTPGGK